MKGVLLGLVRNELKREQISSPPLKQTRRINLIPQVKLQSNFYFNVKFGCISILCLTITSSTPAHLIAVITLWKPRSGKLLEILAAEFSLFAGVVASGPSQHTVFESTKLSLKRLRQPTQHSSSNLISMYFSYQLCIWKSLRRSVLLYCLTEWQFEPSWCNMFMFSLYSYRSYSYRNPFVKLYESTGCVLLPVQAVNLEY